MVAGVAAMNLEYQIKKEIPQEQDALNEYIQDFCFCDKHIKPVPYSPTQLILPLTFQDLKLELYYNGSLPSRIGNAPASPSTQATIPATDSQLCEAGVSPQTSMLEQA